MTTKEKIIQLYEPLTMEEKRDFKMLTCEKFNKGVSAIYNWWFSKRLGYVIPDKHQEKVLNELIILHHKKGTLSLYTEKQEV